MYRNLKRMVFGLAASIGLAGAGWAAPFTGPISPYYLDNIVNQTIYVVQGTSVVNSFPWSYGPGCPNFCEAVLAIPNGHVATNWVGFGIVGFPGVAGQYTPAGTPTGVSWPDSSPPPGTDLEFILDGTSDGVHNFSVQNAAFPGQTNIVGYDAHWQQPTSLFQVPEGFGGITYDRVDNALWVSGVGLIAGGEASTVSEYSLTGTLLTSFTTLVPDMTALAYDPADNTLWFSAEGGNILVQYSKTGTLLQFGTPTGLPLSTYLAGEIAVPEPGSLALLGAGLAGLWGTLRRRNSRLA